MIVDQLFSPKPLKEGGPYDLPGKDYDRPGDTPRQPRPQGDTSPRRHPDDPDFMDPDQRRLRADQARVKKAQDEYHAKKGVAEGNGRDLTNTPRDQFISRMTPSMDANELRQKVAKIVNSPGFTEDTILQIVDAGDNLSHPAGRYIQQAFYGLQYNLGKEYEDYPERVAEKLLSQFRSMLPAYRVTEADEWEEDTEKRERFLKYAKQKLMASNGNIEMASALSQQDNKIFGSPFLNDPATQQAPAGAVSIIDNRPYTRAIAQIMAYIESKQGQAEISATQAALWLTPQGKKFLERVSTDLYGIDDNAARKKHAIALSGYQVQHLGGKITGSYYGPDDFHSAEQNMTKEVAAIYDLVTLELEREAGIEGDARERQKDMAFWNAIPYPLKVVMCASLGKTPGQMESILFGTEADMLASHFGNKKPKPNADPTPAEPKKLGETGIGRAVNDKGLTQQRWLQLVQTKFPTAKIVQAKMIDGPCRATLPDGRTLSWTKVEQGVAEKAGDLRPKLGSARDKGKSVRKWRNDRGLNESMLMEDPIYRDFKRVGQYISEQKLTEPEILQIFSNAETGMTDKGTGANRTFLGRGKDTTMDFASGVADALKTVWGDLQKSVPVAAVDVAYDQATDALANLTGGQKGAVMQAIKKYRNLAKQYPKTAGLSKAALVAIAGLATGGAGLPAVAALVYGLDSSIKGEKLSDIALKAGGAAATAWAAGKLFGGGTQPDPTDSVAGLVDPTDSVAGSVDPTPDLATYTVQDGDNLSKLAARFDTSVAELRGLNPQLAAASGATGGQNLNPDVIFPGQEITLPPGTPGTDVYAGGVGTSADTMADIAKGNVPNSPISQAMAAKGQTVAGGRQFDLPATDAAQNAAVDAQVRADYAAAGPAEKAEILKTTGTPPAAAPSQAVMRTPFQMTTQVAGIPVIPGQPLNPTQMMVADFSMQQGNQLSPVVQAAYDLAKRGAVRESVRFKTLPAEQMIDQKLTVLSWALNESVNRKQNQSVHLTNKGVYTVFENVDRYRRAIMEYTQPGREQIPNLLRPDMSGAPVTPDTNPGMIGRGLNALDRFTSRVGSGLSTFGRQFTTGVTKEKLKMNWHQDGKPTDSDQLAAWLVTQKVPQQVVTDVFSKMGIPYTAPAAEPTTQPAAQAAAPKTGGASTQAYAGINPATKKPWTQQELRDKFYPEPATDSTASADTEQPPASAATATSATVPAAGTFPGEDPKGPGYVGRREVARRQAARDAEAAKKPAAPNFAQQGGGYKSVTYAPNIKTGANLPKPTAPAAPTTTPTKTPTQAERDAYVRSIGAPAMAENRIAMALKKPVAEMLQMVETKEDVQRIKQFVDDTFVKHGAVNESAFAMRNQILEHVTQVGAQRRREHSQRVAH